MAPITRRNGLGALTDDGAPLPEPRSKHLPIAFRTAVTPTASTGATADDIVRAALNAALLTNPRTFALLVPRGASVSAVDATPVRVYANDKNAPMMVYVRAANPQRSVEDLRVGGNSQDAAAESAASVAAGGADGGFLVPPNGELWVSVIAADYPANVIGTPIPVKVRELLGV